MFEASSSTADRMQLVAVYVFCFTLAMTSFVSFIRSAKCLKPFQSVT